LHDDDAKVPRLYDEKSGVMISYDDAESLRLKAEYVTRQKLGGVMVWEEQTQIDIYQSEIAVEQLGNHPKALASNLPIPLPREISRLNPCD
jgi:GH18 family chitinase